MDDVDALPEAELLAAAQRGGTKPAAPFRLLGTDSWEGTDNLLVRYATAD